MTLILFSGTALTELQVLNHSQKSHLPIITCECGYKILLLPDLKAMNHAIQNHLSEHKNRNAKNAKVKKIEDALISKIFEKASESRIQIVGFPR